MSVMRPRPSANKPILVTDRRNSKREKRWRSDKRSFRRGRTFNGETEMRRRLVAFWMKGVRGNGERGGAARRQKKGRKLRFRNSSFYARDSALLSVMLGCFVRCEIDEIGGRYPPNPECERSPAFSSKEEATAREMPLYAANLPALLITAR